MLAQEAGISFIPLPGRPLASSTGALRAITCLARGLLQARAILRREEPDVVIGTGGFASTALAAAQASLRKPLVILEGNVILGRTNKLLARRASAVCIAFNPTRSEVPAGRAVLTGFPVRRNLLERQGKKESRAALGLDGELFTLLVMGGSQGASFLNDLIRSCAERLTQDGVQTLHQLGAKNTTFEAPMMRGWMRVGYIEDMGCAYGCADLALSRAGASALAELAVQGIPTIAVPYPFAQGGHQEANAAELAGEKRLVMALQENLTPGSFIQMISELKADETRLDTLGKSLLKWGRPKAAEDVADVAIAVASGSFNSKDFRESTGENK